MDKVSCYRRLLNQPNWQTDFSGLPIFVSEWLNCQHSLTVKMQAICSNLQIEIIHQGWCEYHHKKNWLREVLIKNGEQPWIFAQTFIPETTVNNVAQAVLTLAQSPLGLWLFPQQPQRLSLEWQQDQKTTLFSRRSTLLLRQFPLEIKELFLEDFWRKT